MNSKTHASIEIGLVGVLSALALCPAVASSTRKSAASGALFLTGISLATDYEGGLIPILSIGQHRALQAACGVGLCVAGLPNAGDRGDKALAAAGAAQLVLAAIGPRHRHAGPPSTVYMPLDTPKQVTDGLWLVDSSLGPGLPVRMSILQLSDGGLVLHSPTRYDPALHRALERIGPICHLIAPNSVHWTFMKSWQDAIPGATTWAAPGLRSRGQVRRSGLRLDHDLTDEAPTVWRREIEHSVVRAGGFTEVAMFHRASRTALLTDLVQNVEAEKLPWLLRPFARVLGNLAPTGRAPAHLRALVRLGGRSDAAAAARRIVGWEPERVLVTHGRPIEDDAAAKLRHSLAWLTGRS